MDNLTTITLVSVCDNHYIMLLAALIKSVEINHKTNEKIEYYIIEDGVTEKNKKMLNSSIDKNTISILWVSMQKNIPDNITLPSDGSTYPMNVYMRLFIPNIIANGVNKVVYLDVDMIVQEDISALWKTDLGDNIIAAAWDPIIKTVSNYGGIANYKDFNLPPLTKYFNSGLLVIDIKKWLQFNVAQKVINCVNSNKKHLMFADQYGLNVVLANNWAELDPRWNSHAEFNEKDPYLIHFSGRKPIFDSYKNSNEFKIIFYNYLAKTEWRNFKTVGETTRYVKKLKNIWRKFKKPFFV